MIQRIQSLYLLVVTALMAVTLFLPLASFQAVDTNLHLRAFAFESSAGESIQSTIYLGVLLLLATIIPFVTIFLFRRRMLQFRLCVVQMVILVGGLILEGLYYYLSQRAFDSLELPIGSISQSSVNLVAALPLACLLLVYLAGRAIFRDEVLVRAADRIR